MDSNPTIRVLIIEDNPVEMALVTALLSHKSDHCFVVSRAGSIAEATEKLRASPLVDLILLDLGLPESRGIATLRTVRQFSAEIPIVILSGDYDEQIDVEASKIGVRNYLVKGQYDGPTLRQALVDTNRLAPMDGSGGNSLVNVESLDGDIAVLGVPEVNRLVALFEQVATTDFDQLADALTDGRAAAAARLAHRLASASASIHLRALSNCFKTIEDAAEASDLPRANAAYGEAEELWESSLASLKTLQAPTSR